MNKSIWDKILPRKVPVPKRSVGRPRNGKRSNPDYTSITALVKKETLSDVKIALMKQDKDMSDLIGELFKRWLKATNYFFICRNKEIRAGSEPSSRIIDIFLMSI